MAIAIESGGRLDVQTAPLCKAYADRGPQPRIPVALFHTVARLSGSAARGLRRHGKADPPEVRRGSC
jgi:hypothetical protein